MKVDLLTLHCIKNYGSVLQTYATEQLLGDYFDEVETINFIRLDTADETLMDEWTRNDHGVKKMIKRVALTPMCNRYKVVFNSFLQKYVHTTEQKYYCDEDFKKYPITADAYCIGSDQVWNSSWNQGFLPAMFLAFAPDNAMKFAFCSSFGKTKLSEEEKKQASPLLDRLEYISVRESTALPVLESMGIKNGIHLLDPTLLLPSAFWDRIAAKRLVDHDYILVYQLNDGEKFDNYAKEFAGRKGLPLVHIGMRMKYKKKEGKVFIMPEVEEFLSLIKYASYVITDSFHGTAFSINYNREIIDIYPEEFSTRLHSILDWAGLLSRHLTDYSNFQIADEPVDYKPINDKLEIERNKAREYLKVVAEQTAANKRR